MKYILPLNIDDKLKLQDLINNTRLYAHGAVNLEYFTIVGQYQLYRSNNGIPWRCPSIALQNNVGDLLKYYYTNPPASLSFIAQIRNSLSSRVCPMCGSFGTGTVDHYLPKEIYPEWAIFSLNLIPSCDCNFQKGTLITQGTARLLHPYFDNILSTQVVTCVFSGNFLQPKIDIRQIGNDLNVALHISKIVKREKFLLWLGSSWSDMKRSPSSIIYRLNGNSLTTVSQTANAIQNCLNDKIGEYGTPNNWSSIFFHGLLNSTGAIDWITNRHNDILNNIIDSLAD